MDKQNKDKNELISQHKMENSIKFTLFGTILLVGYLASCSTNSTKKTQLTKVNYPGPLPDTIAQRFLPNVVSIDGLDFNSAFSIDGKTFYFSRSKNRKYIILESKFDGKLWTEPIASPLFDTLYSNTDPFITSDSSIYFISNRPKNKLDTTDDYDIYRLRKKDNKWSEPENLIEINSDSTEYYVSVSNTGNIYFASYRDGNLDLFMSKKMGTYYQKPVNLGVIINSTFDEHDALIAPDESYLIFTSSRAGGFGEADLYISFRINNKWEKPKNMGNKINTNTYEYCPNFSVDGKYLFYSSESDVKWISTEILKKYSE